MNERRVVLTRASSIKSERLRWLWAGRVPLRGLTVVSGEKGLGKSLLTNAQLVAAVTRGTLDGELEGKPSDVLVVTAEDDWRAIVKPRLLAHGADVSRVHRVTVEDDEGETVLTLPGDVANLEGEIVRLSEQGADVALLVVDPIGAFISEGTNSHADAPVRRVLAPLAALADRRSLAVAVVMHLSKDESRRLLSRVSGSGAFVNAARSVLTLVRDPEDPKGEQGNQRLLVHVASNWGRYAPTLAFHVESRSIDTDDHEQTEVGFLAVDGQSSLTVDDIQRQEDVGGDDVEEAVGRALDSGPKPSHEVKAAVMTELDCSRATVERASMRMRERGELAIESSGFPRRTVWSLARSPHTLPPGGEATEGTTAQSQESGPFPHGDLTHRAQGEGKATGSTDNRRNGFRTTEQQEQEAIIRGAS